MDFILKGHNYRNEVISIVQAFFPYESYKQTDKVSGNELFIESEIKEGTAFSRLFQEGKVIREQAVVIENTADIKSVKNRIKISLYTLFSEFTGMKMKWGILTGIRPAKFVRNLMLQGISEQDIYSLLKKEYLVDEEKINLSVNVAKKEEAILSSSAQNSKSLYIGIPFCPTKCLYCSFTSYPIKLYKNSVADYISALLKEMDYAGSYVGKSSFETIYIGGGTPTSIDAKDLETILYHINDKFNFSNTKEFCVEAGRPDTITAEKLKILKKYNVSRISINPQTMNNQTLKLIGRSHTVEEFLDCYHLALNEGFENINIDLILGLLGEEKNDVIHTFEEISKLNPKSVTVHTLTVKRASRLKEELSRHHLQSTEKIEEFLKIAASYMKSLYLDPYYLYRQKNTVGNFENVGYATFGFECVYNIQIMEERQDIVALGAGSASKYINLERDRIERAFNVKEPLEYIERIDEMIARKKRLEEIIC